MNSRPMPTRLSLHGDRRFDVDVPLAHRQAESRLHDQALFERARRPHGHTAPADVQRDRRGNVVTEAVGDGNPSTTRGPVRRLKSPGKRWGASDGKICWSAVYSLT